MNYVSSLGSKISDPRTQLAALVLFLAVAAPVAGEVVLTSKTNVKIVEVGDFGNAGGWMQELLEKYLLLALKKDTLAGQGDVVEFVIEARAPAWRDVPREDIKDIADIDAFDIETRSGDPSVVHISGATVLAAGFGIMHFLEESLGIMWLFPGELGLHVPDRERFVLPDGKKRIAPRFVSRLCTGFVYRDKSIPAKRFRYEGLLHKTSGFFYAHDYYKSVKLHHLASPSHNMINIFPLSTREDHPELLPIKDGERWIPPDKDSPKGKVGWWQAWHPCYTKAATVEIAAEKAREAFENGRYCFSLGINDGHRVQCECETCKQVGWPNSYYQFVSRVAEKVKDAYPPHMIGLIAYGDVKYPPDDLVLPDNVLIMCVSGGPYRHIEWSKHAKILGTYEWAHGQGYWIPNFPLAGMKSNARFYKEQGIRFFRAEMHPMWAFDGPRVYLQLRLLWDPDFDVEAGLDRYCRAAFGNGGPAMAEFHRYWARKLDGGVLSDGVTPVHRSSWPGGVWRNVTKQLAWCSPRDFEFSSDCIKRAGALVKTEQERKRLQMVATFFEDSQMLFGSWDLKNRAFMGFEPQEAKGMLDAALALRGRRTPLLQRMHDHPEWFLGTAAEVNDDMEASWEARGGMILDQELDTVAVTALVDLQQHPLARTAAAQGLPARFQPFLRPVTEEPLRLYARDRNAWYKEWGYARLEATKSGPVIEFSTTNTSVRITDHPVFKGKRKIHWLSGLVLKAPFGESHAYVLELDVRGCEGQLDARVAWGSGNVRGTAAQVFEAFGPEERTVRKRFVFAPWLGGEKEWVSQGISGTDLTGNIDVYLLWVPETDTSPLEGSLTIRKLTFGEGEAVDGDQ